jgi:hypothetical protein
MRERLALVVVAGVAGSVLFWVVQVTMGGPTITAFMGEQVAAAGGYPATLAPALGWLIHVAVGLSYASLFAVVLAPLRSLPRTRRAGLSLVIGIALGSLTTAIAPPANQRDDRAARDLAVARRDLSFELGHWLAVLEPSGLLADELDRPGVRRNGHV